MTDDNNGGGTEVSELLGPYEAWNFGHGRPYALPIMRKFNRYVSALAELGPDGSPQQALQTLKQRRCHFPTLWKELPKLSFIPFVIDNGLPEHPQPRDLGTLLQTELSFATDELLDAHLAEILEHLDVPDSPNPAAVKNFSRLSDFANHPDFKPFADRLSGMKHRIRRSRYRIAFPIADHAMRRHPDTKPTAPSWEPDEDLPKRLKEKKRERITVIAVIDDGLPFAHRNFRAADGKRTRVEFCWLQSVKAVESQKSVLFGREYTRDNINGWIRQYGEDEDALYRAAGATADTEELGLIDRHATHGAHVMDLAAGYAAERGEEPPDEIRIIAVQLPNTIAWDTSGFGKDMYMLSAFHYIFDRADIIAQAYGIPDLRLVINFSYGFSGGRHDGETELEAAINEMIARRRTRKHGFFRPSPTALVLPAGNMFLDRLHGTILPRDFINSVARLRWRIQPTDRTPNYLELWFELGVDPRGYTIELFDPGGERRHSFTIAAQSSSRKADGENPIVRRIMIGEAQIGQISLDLHRPTSPNDTRGRWRILIVTAPTEPECPALPRVEAGQWVITIKSPAAEPPTKPIHCWIQRDADPESLRSGSRQSYFEDDQDRYTPQGDLAETDHGGFVERFGSLNGLATGRTSLVAAGYRLGAGLGSPLSAARPASYSSAGMSTGKQVACSSMSDRSRVLPGTIAAGVRSGSLSLLQGTSSAAPFVARRLVEIFLAADAASVTRAERENYLRLLGGAEQQTRPPDGAPLSAEGGSRKKDAPLQARLGTVRVPPHWQPGIERTASGES
jgi:hypothetical protein